MPEGLNMYRAGYANLKYYVFFDGSSTQSGYFARNILQSVLKYIHTVQRPESCKPLAKQFSLSLSHTHTQTHTYTHTYTHTHISMTCVKRKLYQRQSLP